MSEVVLQELVVRLATDPAFAAAVKSDAATTLAPFDLSPDEVNQLTALSDDAGTGASQLATRQSKSNIFMMGAPHLMGDGGAAAHVPVDHAPITNLDAVHTTAPTAPAPDAHLVIPPTEVHVQPVVDHSLAPTDAPPLHPTLDHGHVVQPPPEHVIHVATEVTPPPAHVDPGAITTGADGHTLYYSDPTGAEHVFHPALDASGHPIQPTPGSHVHADDIAATGKVSGGDWNHVSYQGVDGHIHHAGGDMSQIPSQEEMAPGGQYWGPDGNLHPVLTVHTTSGGQEYFVDSQGHGHAFYPATDANGHPIQPDPNHPIHFGVGDKATGMQSGGVEYLGLDGHAHHMGGDPTAIPGQSDLGPGGQYWGPDGNLHPVLTVHTTSTGHEYFVDSQGRGHAFFPATDANGHALQPDPNHAIHLAGGDKGTGMQSGGTEYLGLDGHVHHMGGDPTAIPGQSDLGPGGQYWGPDGNLHPLLTVHTTSTGHEYFVDAQGHGHAFFPATDAGGHAIQPDPNHPIHYMTGREGTGMQSGGTEYLGLDGHVHHAGSDPSAIPGQSDPGPGGQYYGPDGQLHPYGTIESTSTGAQYYVDTHGVGHAFQPATDLGGHPIPAAPGAHVDDAGNYMGVDGHVHHSGPTVYTVQQAPEVTGQAPSRLRSYLQS